MVLSDVLARRSASVDASRSKLSTSTTISSRAKSLNAEDVEDSEVGDEEEDVAEVPLRGYSSMVMLESPIGGARYRHVDLTLGR